MHELSIAVNLVEIAVEEARRQGAARAHAVHLRLGPLSGVVGDALRSAYEVACVDTPLAGSKLLIEETPVEIFCRRCGCERAVVSIQDMRCRLCRTPSSQVVRGRELELHLLEVIDEPVGESPDAPDAATR